MSTDVMARAKAWLAHETDPQWRQLLRSQLEAARCGDTHARQELERGFSDLLTFGTAGLRGQLGPGPSRMNGSVVAWAACGFAEWLVGQGLSGPVLIGYDARHRSREFAEDTAAILAGAGFSPLTVSHPIPTPVVAFGIQHFGCVAGIVVTASHNPPRDNGYKVYLGDGSQIVSPADAEIHHLMAHASERPATDIVRRLERQDVTSTLLEAYVSRAAAIVPRTPDATVSWVHTAMHGVGAETLERAAERAGFPPPHSVASQRTPDPDFPTVAFPNPEEPGALDEAIALAEETGADVLIANDPDADRCAVALPSHDGWHTLTGDQLGILLADDALRRGAEGTLACSVVSSTMLSRLAEEAGRPFRATLTGFKWIGRVPDLAFGYEEAIGYCCDPEAVPDKDGITAALRVLTMCAQEKSDGRRLADRLDGLQRRLGLHTTSQLSVRVEDLGRIRRAMERIRRRPPTYLLARQVTVTDLAQGTADLPATDAVELTASGIHVVVRPSGTEPKLKCYLEHRLSPAESQDLDAARIKAAEAMDQLRGEMRAALGLDDPR